MTTFFWHNVKSSRGFWIKAIVLLILVGVLTSLPIKIPVTVSAIGKVFPAHKWILSRENDGQLVTSLIDYRHGINDGYSVSQFAREGTVRFQLRPGLTDERMVNAGDTIGSMYSSETEEQLTELTAELAVARAALVAGRAGEKESLVREARKNLEFAEIDATRQQSVYARMQELFAKDLVSREEFEAVESETDLKNLQVEIAGAQLQTATSGENPENLQLLRTNIDALQKRIEVIKKRQESFSIVSPITGIISKTYSPDTLLVISDTSEYVAVIPIRRTDCTVVAIGQKTRLASDGGTATIDAEIIEMDNNLQSLNDQQVVLAVAGITDTNSRSIQGMMLNCRIECCPMTPLQYLKRILYSLLV